MPENQNVSVNYEKMYEELLAKNKTLEEQFAYELSAKEKQYEGVIQNQQVEINWLKSVISSILHI